MTAHPTIPTAISSMVPTAAPKTRRDEGNGCPEPHPVVLDAVDRCPGIPDGVASDDLDSCPEDEERSIGLR
jgi:hypothetical protein